MRKIVQPLQYSVLALLFVSCATTLTSKGKAVRLITSNQKEHCKYIDIITESNEMGWDAADDKQNALNQTRNRAAELGGNAIHLISNSTDSQGAVLVGSNYVESSQAVVQAEVFFCRFKKKSELKEI